MYVSIDMKELRVVHKHPSMNVVSNLVYLESPKSVCYISTIESCLKHLTEMEIKMLYRNIFGGDKIPANARQQLSDHILNKVPVTDVIPDELARLAATVGPNDKKTYKYVKGQYSSFMSPSIFQEQPAHPKVHAEAPPPYIPKKANSLDGMDENEPMPVDATPVRQHREPRIPGESSDRPKAGSTTGKVWDIADEVAQTVTDPKTLRKAVIERCTQEGINNSTASVQFGKWKNSR